MYSRYLRELLLLQFLIGELVAQSTTHVASSSSGASSSIAATTTAANRITYAELPSCASSCVASAVRSVPCTPFVASCFCALPTGRLAYELPVECVNVKCGQDDIKSEQSWRESVCSGFNTTTNVGLPNWSSTPVETVATTTLHGGTHTEVCESGWNGCPKGLNGGCCPSDNFCNLLDCEPSPLTPTVGVTKISSPTEVPAVDIASLFPECSHQCISQYLPKTQCGISPLNTTCLCRMHDIFPCLSGCDADDVQNFLSAHVEICKPLWFFEPYNPTFERWCDLVEGSGKRGRPFGYDARMGSLEHKCPDWWEQRSPGKRFGIVLGIFFSSFFFVCGCNGYWLHIGEQVTRKDRAKAEERRKMMEMSDETDPSSQPGIAS